MSAQIAQQEPDAAIYLVESDPALRMEVAASLAGLDWPVYDYPSPRGLLAALPRQATGCLVANIALTGMDAVELQRELTRLGHRLRVILLSYDIEVPDAVAAMRAGVDDILPLPVVQRLLRRRVSTAMSLLEKKVQKDL